MKLSTALGVAIAVMPLLSSVHIYGQNNQSTPVPCQNPGPNGVCQDDQNPDPNINEPFRDLGFGIMQAGETHAWVYVPSGPGYCMAKITFWGRALEYRTNDGKVFRVYQQTYRVLDIVQPLRCIGIGQPMPGPSGWDPYMLNNLTAGGVNNTVVGITELTDTSNMAYNCHGYSFGFMDPNVLPPSPPNVPPPARTNRIVEPVSNGPITPGGDPLVPGSGTWVDGAAAQTLLGSPAYEVLENCLPGSPPAGTIVVVYEAPVVSFYGSPIPVTGAAVAEHSAVSNGPGPDGVATYSNKSGQEPFDPDATEGDAFGDFLSSNDPGHVSYTVCYKLKD